MAYDFETARKNLATIRRDVEDAARKAVQDAQHASFTLMQDAITTPATFVKVNQAVSLGGYAERIEANRALAQQLEAQLQNMLYAIKSDAENVEALIAKMNEQDGND